MDGPAQSRGAHLPSLLLYVVCMDGVPQVSHPTEIHDGRAFLHPGVHERTDDGIVDFISAHIQQRKGRLCLLSPTLVVAIHPVRMGLQVYLRI